MISSIIDVETGRVLLADIPSSGGGSSPDLTSLTNKVNALEENAIQSNIDTTQTLSGAFEVTDQLDIKSSQDEGSFQVGFTGGSAYIATNNGLHFLSNCSFDKATTTSDTTTYSDATPDMYIRKQQVAQVLADYTTTDILTTTLADYATVDVVDEKIQEALGTVETQLAEV